MSATTTETEIKLLVTNIVALKARLRTATDKDSIRRQIKANQARLRDARLIKEARRG